MFTAQTCAQRKPAARPKNRVRDFFDVPETRVPAFSPPSIYPHQETFTASTTTVSGIVYWLSKDPIGISGGLNQYVFCGNNPVMFIDPFGLCEDGDQVLQNIRDFYDALEKVATDKWWVNDAFLEYMALFSLSGGPWGPLDFKAQGSGPFSVGDQVMQGDEFGNYVAGYQAGYGDADGLLTGVFFGGELWASGPGDEPAGDADSVPDISQGFYDGRDARMNR